MWKTQHMRTILSLLMIHLFPFGLVSAQDTPSNSHFWYKLETEASPEQIWAIWTDVSNWKAWDDGLTDASIEGVLELGARGIIISLEGRRSQFTITEFEKGNSYTFRSKLPLGALHVRRYLSEKGGKTVFTHEVWFSGITKGIFGKAFGAKFRAMLPQVLVNIKELAEEDKNLN